MPLVTRNQSERLSKFKLKEFLDKHQRLSTRELKMYNLIQMFEFLSSFESKVLVCRNEVLGNVVAKKIFELTSEGFCPKLSHHYFREIFENRGAQLHYSIPSKPNSTNE